MPTIRPTTPRPAADAAAIGVPAATVGAASTVTGAATGADARVIAVATGVDAVAQRGSTPGVGGPVEVSWDAETSSGLTIARYVVTASNGSVEIPFEADGSATSLTVPGDQLNGGAIDDDEAGDWSFTVAAVSERSGNQLAGQPSDSSPSVDLFTVVPELMAELSK